MSFGSDMAELLDNGVSTENTSSPTPKNFLGRLIVRKPSILSISSAASSQSSASPNPIRRSISPMQDDEKRKILKMLISPSSERRPSKNINDFMKIADQTIKAAKSAENLCTYNQVRICMYLPSLIIFNYRRSFVKNQHIAYKSHFLAWDKEKLLLARLFSST